MFLLLLGMDVETKEGDRFSQSLKVDHHHHQRSYPRRATTNTHSGEKEWVKMNNACFFFFWLISILTSSAAAADSSSNECVYSLYVKTGSMIKAGTDAKISIALGDAQGRSVWAGDLRAWGLMGHTHDYFERAGLDIFSARAPCIATPICRLNLTSDGAGHHHGWFCDYLEVTATGPHRRCSQSVFYVNRWLADDAPPYDLSAVLDGCARIPLPSAATEGTLERRFVVGTPLRSNPSRLQL